MTWFLILHYQWARVCVDGLHGSYCVAAWLWAS